MWKTILRLEEKVDRLHILQCCPMPNTPSNANASENVHAPDRKGAPQDRKHYAGGLVYNQEDDYIEYDNEEAMDECEEDEDEGEYEEDYMNDPETLELMKSVFGDPRQGSMSMDGTSPLIMVFSNATGTDLSSPPPPPPTSSVTIQEISNSEIQPVQDDASEATGAVLSKTKLKKMTTEQLKDYCASQHLPSDGTKQQLIDRIIAHMQF